MQDAAIIGGGVVGCAVALALARRTGRSRACPELVNVAAIRSTGLTASLGIAEHVVELLGVDAPESPRPQRPAVESGEWWR